MIERTYKSRLTTGNKADRAGAAYALALLASEHQQKSEARRYLDLLEKDHKNSLFVQLLSAEVLFNEGKRDESYALLDLLKSVYPDSFSIVEMSFNQQVDNSQLSDCLLYTSPSPRDATLSRMPSSA